MGLKSVQIGTRVKLIRVLMLGPVCLVLSLLTPRLADESGRSQSELAAGDRPGMARPKAHQLVPWFIVGFLGMVVLRSASVIPVVALTPISNAATVLTVVSMAGLGLGVDIRTVCRAGIRVTTTVVLSLLALGTASFGLIRLLGL